MSLKNLEFDKFLNIVVTEIKNNAIDVHNFLSENVNFQKVLIICMNCLKIECVKKTYNIQKKNYEIKIFDTKNNSNNHTIRCKYCSSIFVFPIMDSKIIYEISLMNQDYIMEDIIIDLNNILKKYRQRLINHDRIKCLIEGK